MTIGRAFAFARGQLGLVIGAVVYPSLLYASLLAAGCKGAAEKAATQAAVPPPTDPPRSDAQHGDAPTGQAQVPGLPSPPTPVPSVAIEVGDQRILFYVQVAMTQQERANGLIGRPTLASDAGVLFIFDKVGLQTLRMKNALIPLDLIFISAERRIVGIIEKAKARTSTEQRIAIPSQYVLEIGAGLSSRLGLRIGQFVEFRAIPATR